MANMDLVPVVGDPAMEKIGFQTEFDGDGQIVGGRFLRPSRPGCGPWRETNGRSYRTSPRDDDHIDAAGLVLASASRLGHGLPPQSVRAQQHSPLLVEGAPRPAVWRLPLRVHWWGRKAAHVTNGEGADESDAESCRGRTGRWPFPPQLARRPKERTILSVPQVANGVCTSHPPDGAGDHRVTATADTKSARLGILPEERIAGVQGHAPVC
jgi:hypothetical protein